MFEDDVVTVGVRIIHDLKKINSNDDEVKHWRETDRKYVERRWSFWNSCWSGRVIVVGIE